MVQIYTGNGKGKTTAAFGLAIRAAGWGKKVLIYQFLKPATLELGERKFIESAGCNIQLRVVDEAWNMWKSFDDAEHVERVKQRIHSELEEILRAAGGDEFDVVILDEIVFCQSSGLVALDDIKKIIDGKSEKLELIMTGRGATPELIELADLVSNIEPIKHPYDNGIHARKGIEF